MCGISIIRTKHEENAKKTKIMTNSNESVQITVDDDELEQVNCFVCLCGKFNLDTGYTDYVKTRLAMGTVNMMKLRRTRKSKLISIATKLHLMTVLFWSVATYDCEALILKKTKRETYLSF